MRRKSFNRTLSLETKRGADQTHSWVSLRRYTFFFSRSTKRQYFCRDCCNWQTRFLFCSMCCGVWLDKGRLYLGRITDCVWDKKIKIKKNLKKKKIFHLWIYFLCRLILTDFEIQWWSEVKPRLVGTRALSVADSWKKYPGPVLDWLIIAEGRSWYLEARNKLVERSYSIELKYSFVNVNCCRWFCIVSTSVPLIISGQPVSISPGEWRASWGAGQPADVEMVQHLSAFTSTRSSKSRSRPQDDKDNCYTANGLQPCMLAAC